MVLFRLFTLLVLVGFVASASVKSSKKPEESEATATQQLVRVGRHGPLQSSQNLQGIEGTGSRQLVRAGRHGPLQLVPQAWYENALVAVSFLSFLDHPVIFSTFAFVE